MLTSAQHPPDASNYDVPEAATSSSQNNVNSNSITIPVVVCGVLLVVIVTAIIIFVAIRSKLCVSLYLSILLIPSKASNKLQVVFN